MSDNYPRAYCIKSTTRKKFWNYFITILLISRLKYFMIERKQDVTPKMGIAFFRRDTE